MQETPTPTPAPPANSSLQPPSGSPSMLPASSVPALVGHAMSAGLAGLALVKVLAWFPACLRIAILPTGGVSHDPWSWIPVVLNLSAAVAIAAPLSFRSILDFFRAIRLPGGGNDAR